MKAQEALNIQGLCGKSLHPFWPGYWIGKPPPHPTDYLFNELHVFSHCMQHHNIPRLPNHRAAFNYLHNLLALANANSLKSPQYLPAWVFGASYLSRWVSSILSTCLPTGSSAIEKLLQFKFTCISGSFKNIINDGHCLQDEFKPLVCDV